MSNESKWVSRLDQLAERGFSVVLAHEPGNEMPWLVVMKRLTPNHDYTYRAGKFSRRFKTASAAILAAWDEAEVSEGRPRIAEVRERTVRASFACPSGKYGFATEVAAEKAATSLTRKNLRSPRPSDRTAARAYACPECGEWHLTSKPFDPVLASLSAGSNET